MGQHHLKITSTTGHGHATKVEMDGQPIERGLRGLGLRVDVDAINEATLELFAPVVEFEGEAAVQLPEDTQTLLKQLGWTPPPD